VANIFVLVVIHHLDTVVVESVRLDVIGALINFATIVWQTINTVRYATL
jgi:hypothetical protein